jgi:hypothetical protein
VFEPPGCVTLWHLPEIVEEEFDVRCPNAAVSSQSSRCNVLFGCQKPAEMPNPLGFLPC